MVFESHVFIQLVVKGSMQLSIFIITSIGIFGSDRIFKTALYTPHLETNPIDRWYL
jgi:hypothetical protein